MGFLPPRTQRGEFSHRFHEFHRFLGGGRFAGGKDTKGRISGVGSQGGFGLTNYDLLRHRRMFHIYYFGAARDNYEVRNEDYGFCSIYGEACDATRVLLGKDAKKVRGH